MHTIDFPVLIERIRAVIYDEGQPEIIGTAQELSEQFGYLEPRQFGRDIGVIEDNLMEFGIDIERSRTPKKRLIIRIEVGVLLTYNNYSQVLLLQS